MNERHVLVVGGGAAGLMAAGTAARAGAKVTILEPNEKMGFKLRITGKGRCNVTNQVRALEDLIAAVPTNGKFLFRAFARFMPADTIAMFESLGVPLAIERGQRVFPASNNAHDIADALDFFARKHKNFVGIRHDRATKLLVDGVRVVGVQVSAGDLIAADAVVLATGGCSYPKTGSTGDGYALASSVGHGIVPPRPSLVPL
ncbi:MAG: aminoacetone oxidase family FAD-binding enzyme, partial [Oscillospiraceae bacterium]|nr:aminoacetone oxidase family FAD-binding enzyme [Oscillospiraceae bacterium]